MMEEKQKIEKALFIVNNTLKDGKVSEEAFNWSFWETVKDALEKQFQMKMMIETEPDREFRDYRCPRCKVILQQEPKTNIGQRFVLHTFKYCPDCGQALDWSDD